MSQSDAGKTDKVANNFRTPQWENTPLWNNWQTKRRNQDIWDAGKEEAVKMGIVTVDKESVDEKAKINR